MKEQRITSRRLRRRLFGAVPLSFFGVWFLSAGILSLVNYITVAGISSQPSVALGSSCLILVGMAWVACSIALVKSGWAIACWTGSFGFGCYALATPFSIVDPFLLGTAHDYLRWSSGDWWMMVPAIVVPAGLIALSALVFRLPKQPE